jgi:hypothetical protein
LIIVLSIPEQCYLVLTNPAKNPNPKNSVSETSLISFKDGESPSRFLDVNDKHSRDKFHSALRISTGELIDFSQSKLQELEGQYSRFKTELREFEAKITGVNSPEVEALKKKFSENTKNPSYF